MGGEDLHESESFFVVFLLFSTFSVFSTLSVPRGHCRKDCVCLNFSKRFVVELSQYRYLCLLLYLYLYLYLCTLKSIFSQSGFVESPVLNGEAQSQ